MGKHCPEVVQIDYQTLVSNADISDVLTKAYGPDGLGILLIRGIPAVQQQRQELLPKAQQLASLPAAELADCEHPQSKYSIGWSCGKESMTNGVRDVSKASWYCNPEVAQPSGVTETDEASYPGYCCPNIPAPAGVPGLDRACNAAGQLAVRCGYALAAALDRYLVQQNGDKPLRDGLTLEQLLRKSQCHKARLLHYFPPKQCDAPQCNGSAAGHRAKEDSWCGEHFDHSILTGLYAGMFLDASGTVVAAPDPQAGLHIRDRQGHVHQVSIPADCLAFQLGETAEVLSGGRLQATSHYVKGPAMHLAQGISRNTYAVFLQPRWDVRMTPLIPRSISARDVLDIELDEDVTFGQFAERKFRRYYGK